MYIKEIRCKHCPNKGRLGEQKDDFKIDCFTKESKVICSKCGNEVIIKIEDLRHQQIMSSNLSYRLAGASNYFETGTIELVQGVLEEVKFKQPFDELPGKAYFRPLDNSESFYVKEFQLLRDGMKILSSSLPEGIRAETRTVKWCVYGIIVDIDDERTPTWHIHFYNAVLHTANELYKPAILDYAATFECFLEKFLMDKITARYDKRIAEYLLKEISTVDDRVKKLVKFAIKTNIDRKLLNYWMDLVQKKRNELAHGKQVSIDIIAVDKANQAVYQIIKWLDDYK